MSAAKNLVGKTFHQLTVVALADRTRGVTFWTCRCTCGTLTKVYQGHLGRQKACGCLRQRLRETPPTGPHRAKYISLGHGIFALVNSQDWKQVQLHLWSLGDGGYPESRIRGRLVRLHEFILGVRGGVDHRNLDKLDNRRGNLRMATPRENSFNKPRRRDNQSGFKGVGFHHQNGSWRARINRTLLGYFKTAAEAAHAYDRAARMLHGQFGRLNFPRKGEQQA